MDQQPTMLNDRQKTAFVDLQLAMAADPEWTARARAIERVLADGSRSDATDWEHGLGLAAPGGYE